MKKVNRLLLHCLLIACMSVVLGCGGGRDSRPGVGEAGVLYIPGKEDPDEDVVLLAVSEEAMEEWDRATVAHDTIRTMTIHKLGLLFATPARTRVLVLDSGAYQTKVRVLDGPKAGKSGFVHTA